jgi:hypothetical protein
LFDAKPPQPIPRPAPPDAGRSRELSPHAATLRSDLRLQAQGSPILLTRF